MSRVSKKLLGFLSTLSNSPRFCSWGMAPTVLPGLQVDQVGDVGLPICSSVAQRLIDVAEKAPHGPGADPVLDANVRNVWQLSPKKIRIQNSDGWNLLLNELTSRIANDFGLNGEVSPSLNKLVIYDQGSFFTSHRDSEKESGMFGTMVVCLPCKHDGGKLLVSHDGRTVEVHFDDPKNQYGIQYAAFYADCLHEIQTVTGGFRICLVYNLCLVNQKSQPTAPQNSMVTQQLGRLLQEMMNQRSITKVAISLNHEYSQRSLRPNQLKDQDRFLCDFISNAADALEYDAHLALLVHHPMGYPKYNAMSYDPYSNETACAGVDMGEVEDEETHLECWYDMQGHPKPLGPMPVDEEEFVGSVSIDLPNEREINETTGNAGASMECWNRQAVIVLWPRNQFYRIVSIQGPDAALPELSAMLKNDAYDLTACRQFAGSIIDHWGVDYDVGKTNPSITARMLMLCLELDDIQIVTRFIKEVLPTCFSGDEGGALRNVCDHYSWRPLGPVLIDFFTCLDPQKWCVNLRSVLSIFQELCQPGEKWQPDQKRTCRQISGTIPELIQHFDRLPFTQQPEKRDRSGIFSLLFASLPNIGEGKTLNAILRYVFDAPAKYDLNEDLLPAIRDLHKNMKPSDVAAKSFLMLFEHCTAKLTEWTESPVAEPKDWVQNITIKCDCDDCKNLQLFLHSAHDRVHRFRVRKDRRQHLHAQIDRHQCDVDHVTERQGSPQTLVCTKNRATFERESAAYEVNRAALLELKEIANSWG